MRFFTLLSTICIFFLSFTGAYSSDDEHLLYFKKAEIFNLKENLESATPESAPYIAQLKEWADVLLNQEPWSIADSKSPSISNNPNDYFSQGPYWWPDPENPNGPFIRRDGERNPDRFMAHKNKLNKMYQASFALIMAGYLFDEQKYTDHALEILHTWFINPEKRMNPNMDYAQAIPNKSPGRGVGIIDVHRFAKLLEAFYILDWSGKWPAEHKQEIKKWFRDFLTWLTTSKNGLDEKEQGNNHTTWWCALVAGISKFVGNEQEYINVYNYLKNDVINEQIKENGSMPHEEKRTRSFDYMNFNLDAFSLVYQNYANRGFDLWEYETKASGSIKKTIEYFYPYASGKSEWPFEQITPRKEKAAFFWYFAAQRLQNRSYMQVYKRKMKADKIEDINSSYDPFLVLINLLITANKTQ